MIEVITGHWDYLTPYAAAVFGLSMWAREAYRGRRVATPCLLSAPVDPILPQNGQHVDGPDAMDEPVATLSEVRARMEPRLVISQAKAAEVLIEFMNSEGAWGYFTASEIEEWWKFAAAMREIESMSTHHVWESLNNRGMKVGQRRLNSPEYATVRQRNPAAVRPVLYRIPKVRSESGNSPAKPDAMRMSRKGSGNSPDDAPASVRMEAA